MGDRPGVLIVDDEPNVVDSLRDLLRFDYRVFGATSVDEALELFRKESLAVVLSDQRMPGTTGVELLGQCCREQPDVTRLLMTGHADIRAVIDAINEGMVYRYIAKPWDPDELQTVIREAMERHDLVLERKRLLDELQARNRELEAANEELRQADEAKTAFIKVASHELRTPLTILTGLTDLAMRSTSGSGAGDWLPRIREAAGRMQHLVDQLVGMLAVGRMDRDAHREPIGLGPLLHRAADDVRVFVDQRGQTLQLEAADGLGTLRADPAMLRDCLNHLLLNAIKFTPDGGRIALRGSREDESVVIVVADTGDGIREEEIPRLFDPFFTSYDVSHHATGKFEYGRRGLGLGLSAVKSLVEFHHGVIRVESRLGEGTTFTIRLPVEGPSN